MEKKGLRAGAARVAISFPEGFFIKSAPYLGIHDDVHVRALVLAQEESVCILSLELPPLEECAEPLRQIASRHTGIPLDHVWITTTCNFSAPHMLSEQKLRELPDERRPAAAQLNETIRSAVAEASSRALANLKTVSVWQSIGESEVNAYRNISTARGWWIGINRDAPAARELTVFQFRAPEGETVATLFHYAVRSSVLYHSVREDGRMLVSSDLTGHASAYVEDQIGGVAIHLAGACADQVPREIPSCPGTDREGNLVTVTAKVDALNIMERLGLELGCDILRIAQYDAVEMKTPSVALHNGVVILEEASCSASREKPVLTAEWSATGALRTLPLSVLRIGRRTILGVQPEINYVTAKELQRRTRFLGRALTVQMVNGGASYLPDRASYDRCTYQALRSGFVPGSAEKLIDAAEALIRKAVDGEADVRPA